MSRLFLAGALGAFLLAAPMSAAEPVKEGTTQFRAKQVLGTKILIKGDTEVGTVDDLVFDDAGNLDYLIVAGKGGKLTTVPWDAAKFDVEKRTAVLNVTAEQYQAVPTYTVTTYPTFYAPAYRTETYRYYGIRPRDLRIFRR